MDPKLRAETIAHAPMTHMCMCRGSQCLLPVPAVTCRFLPVPVRFLPVPDFLPFKSLAGSIGYGGNPQRLKSAKASMASGHVDAPVQSLQTLQTLQIRGGFTLPLPPPLPPLGQLCAGLEGISPYENMLPTAVKPLFFEHGVTG